MNDNDDRTNRRGQRWRTSIGGTAVLVAMAANAHAAPAGPGFPRIGNLWGCSPGSTEYDQWARRDLLVLAGGSQEEHRKFADEVRSRNPDILLLGSAPLMNIGSPEGSPWMEDEWFLRRPNGEMVNWWVGQVYVPNIMVDECLGALVEQTAKSYGDLLEEGVLNGVFYDSVVGSATWLGEVDTDRDGVADVPADINPKWHLRQNAFFDRLRERWPQIVVLANDVDMDHAPHLHGRLFEGATLLDRLTSGDGDLKTVLGTLGDWVETSLKPPATFAIMTHPVGWQGWRVGKGNKVTTEGEVDRVRRDFRRMRTGLISTLMTDAYFAYDVGTIWYGLPFWYAEYDAPLGAALGPAREITDVAPLEVLDWQAGDGTQVFARGDYAEASADGLRLEAPADSTNWVRLIGTNPRKLRLRHGKRYRIRATCEVLTQAGVTFQFCVRTGRGGWELHDKGVVPHGGQAGETWEIDVTVEPDDFDDYAVEWHCLGPGALLVTSLHVELVGESYFIREFEGGIALLNAAAGPITVELDEPMRRIADDEAPLHYLDIDDASEGFSAQGAWELRGGEGHHYGDTYRAARKPGERASWTFEAPSTDEYTIFACTPGGDGATSSAAYSLGRHAAVLDQTQGEGEWARLFEARLRRGRRYEVSLLSGGTGTTIADAIRIESGARLNDGSLVRSVTLAPNDGTILLRG